MQKLLPAETKGVDITVVELTEHGGPGSKKMGVRSGGRRETPGTPYNYGYRS